MTTETKTKPYRVTLHVAVEVEVEVDADSIEAAQAKAYEWSPPRDDWQQIGAYTIYHDDETETDLYDDNEMYWNIPAWEFEKFGEVLELDDEEEEEEDNHVTQNG